MKLKLNKIIAACLLLTFLPLSASWAFDLPNHNYPRTANLFWKTPLTPEETKELAKWDVVVLAMRAQDVSREAILELRRLNPKIIILAYTSATEVPRELLKEVEPDGVGPWHDLTGGIKNQWYLKTYAGENVIFWSGNVCTNPRSTDENGISYAAYLADFYQNKILSTGLWDGLFFDNTWQTVAWLNANIDIDNDGQPDSTEKINSLWREGEQGLFTKLRQKFGNRYLIIGNGDGEFGDLTNGRMFEDFPLYWEGGWVGSIKKYESLNTNGYLPRLNIINSDSNNTGDQNDFTAMRLGLASALLYDGYYSFDYGPQLREHLWWYDEFNFKLGQPKSAPINLKDNSSEIKRGVWKREFINGLVLVNSTDNQEKLKFDSEYERLHGQQDPQTNNGQIINELILNPFDGAILLRPIEAINNAVFVNGSFARIFNSNGQNIRTGFFAYTPLFKGSSKVITADINTDGRLETVSANHQQVAVSDADQQPIASWHPYGEKYSGSISLALADLNGDGQKEIITAPETGGANLIKIFSWQGEIINPGWHAFSKNWQKLGANVAVGDISGDGQKEIIVGAGAGGGPHVRIFDKNGKLISSGFFAYSAKTRSGVNLASADINGDKVDEIIAGAGFGSAPEVKIFSGQGRLLGSWLAYSSQSRTGVKVTTSDLDEDGVSEILALTTNVFTTSLFKKTSLNSLENNL
jgi:hypothetical protein